MKIVKFLSILIFSLAFSCKTSNEIKEEFIKVGTTRQPTPDPNGARHKPNGSDKTNNYFDLKEKTLNLKIPLTNDNLRINKDFVVNVSSKKHNAVFINLDGNNGQETNTLPISGYLICKIPFGKIKGDPLDIAKLRKDNKLIVYVVHDDNPSCLKPYFESCVQHLNNYIWIECNIEYVCDNKKVEPKEQDGDVIGGNQK